MLSKLFQTVGLLRSNGRFEENNKQLQLQAELTNPELEFSVFWDAENVQLPKNMEYSEAITRFQRFLGSRFASLSNAHGQMTAVGNLKTGRRFQSCRSENIKVEFHHIDSVKKNAADIALVEQIAKTMFHCKPPHTIFLISGDSDFTGILEILKSLKYDVFLISRHGSNGLVKADNAMKDRWFCWSEILSHKEEEYNPNANPKEENGGLFEILNNEQFESLLGFRTNLSGLIPQLSKKLGVRQETFFRKGGKRALNLYLQEAERLVSDINPNLMSRKKYDCAAQAQLSNSLYNSILHVMAKNLKLSISNSAESQLKLTHSLKLYLRGAQRIGSNLGVSTPPPLFASRYARHLHQLSYPAALSITRKYFSLVKPLIYRRG